MAKVALTKRALADLERLAEFHVDAPALAARVRERIESAIDVLVEHPRIGRPLKKGRRELIITLGAGAYLALYSYFPAKELVVVLAVRHSRESDYPESN